MPVIEDARQADIEDVTTCFRFECEREALLAALNRVRGVVAGDRPTVEVLKYILLKATPGLLRVTGTDMEIAISADCAAETTQPGSCAVPGLALYGLIMKLPKGARISFVSGAMTVAVSSGRTRAQIQTLSTNEYPIFGDGEYAANFTIARGSLLRMIERTRFAISRNDTRWYLGGIHLCGVKLDGVSILRAEATDGNVVGRADEPMPEGVLTFPDIIIPRRAVEEIVRITDGMTNLDVSISEARIRIEGAGLSFVSKLIDGGFPDIERVVPRWSDHPATIDKKALVAALDLIGVAAKAARMTISPDGIKVETGDGDEATKISTEIERGDMDYDGEERVIGFLISQLRPVVDLMADRIEISIGGASHGNQKRAAVPVFARDPADRSAIYLVTPYLV